MNHLGGEEGEFNLLHLLAALSGGGLPFPLQDPSNESTNRTQYKEYVLVAAIDFGTTFSGYAFSFKSDKDDIKMNKNWGAEVGFLSYKTPTCILLEPDGTFKSFGYEAQQDYCEPELQDRGCLFFERFKMRLHNVKELNRDTTVKAANGKKMKAIDIFSLSLKYLKDHLVSAITQATEGGIAKEMIRWVITVPAIWSDASKQFMREAALQAGLIDELDSKQMIIALEPEVASLFVRKLEINQFSKKSAHGASALMMSPGTQYLVVDAGGGTVDITAHELLPDGKLKELHYATGGAFGGTKVDKEFVRLMEDIFGKQFIDKFKTENASQWLQMVLEFEKKKRMKREGKTTNIQLTWDFGRLFGDYAQKDLAQAFREYENKGIKFANGVMCIDDQQMQGLFRPAINGILSHIEDLLKHPKLQNLSYFFCVGGFNESCLLQEAIKTKFEGKIKVLVPEEASLAVIKGAVIFGHRPDSVSSRVSAKTYGVKSAANFIPFIHQLDKAVKVDGELYVRGIFREFVQKGEEVPVDFTKTISFSPLVAEQSEAEVEVYSVDRQRVMYVTDSGVEHNASVHVDWPGSGKDRKLEISMSFGGTEIQVSAVGHPGGQPAKAKINFLTD